jgi:aspartate/methionine/tyrosine aminotransferase
MTGSVKSNLKLYVDCIKLMTIADFTLSNPFIILNKKNPGFEMVSIIQEDKSRSVLPSAQGLKFSRYLQEEIDELDRVGETFGTMTILKLASDLEQKGKDVIYCAESIMSTRVPDPVLAQTKRLLKSQTSKYYTPFNGVTELRQAIANRFQRLYGQKVDPETQVVTTSGSMEAEYHTMQALLNPGDEVIIPIPGFLFHRQVKLVGGIPVFYQLRPENNYFHDASEIEKLITDKTKVIVVCNPHNPTGRVLTEEEMAGIAELSIKHNLVIMHDQVYERIVFDGRKYLPMAKFRNVHDRLISVTSFSKVFNMMNYRLGYAVGPPELMRGIALLHRSSTGGISAGSQIGAVAALKPAFEDKHVAKMVALLQKWRDYAIESLSPISGLPIIKPEGTNLLLPNISSFGMSSMDFCLYLLKEVKVAAAPGDAYHAEGHVRISLRTERNEEMIDRIAKAIKKLAAKK